MNTVPKILERVQEGIAAFDLGLHFTYINSQGANILHCDPAAVIGKNFTAVFPETKDSALSHAHEQAARTQQPVEVVGFFAPGSCWLECRLYPSDEGMTVLYRDVTDRRQADISRQDLEELNRTLELHVQERTAQLRQSRDELSIANIELEKASRLKNEFLASMSHELRTPLTGILGLSEALLLDTYGVLNERQQKALANIEKSGRHLLDLINDILDLSKIEAGKLEFLFSICSASEIARSSLQLMMGMAQQKHQRVGFTTNSNAILLRADPRRLKQMLVNLLSNAVKFTPEGGEIGLEIEGDETKQTARFTVWDRGIGIKPEDMDRLFKAFVQIDSSLSRQYSGTGLGLALVKRMAERHGGSVEVESVLGEGSRFTIVLPWVTTDRSPGDNLILQPYPRKTKDTLTIEDNHLDAEHITRCLSALGVVNHIFPQAAGAFAKAAALQPGIIILDLNLADGTGMQVLKELKSDLRTHTIPVIVISVEDHRAEAAALGAAGYLEKPFNMLDLHGEIARMAANTRAEDPVMRVSANTAMPTLLIADDSKIIRDTLADFCKSQNYAPVLASGGEELLERAGEVHPQILLIDLQMPGLNGIETIRKIRAHSHPEIAAAPIIALTDLEMAGERETALQAGANEYLPKPISLPQLAQSLARYAQAEPARR
jgi:signal transduction histidine kinase/DNA-binding response OmpR family regulator